MQSTLEDKLQKWKIHRSAPDASWVLALEDGSLKRFVEDPVSPQTEALEALAPRRGKIALLVIPPCSPATIKSLFKYLPGLERIFVVDDNCDRLKAWEKNSECSENVEILLLSKDQLKAREALAGKLNQFTAKMFLGRSSVYMPRRFRRLEPEFSKFLEETILWIQREACSSAAFRATRSWHIMMNQLLNIAKNRKIFSLSPFVEGQIMVIVGAGPSLDKNVKILSQYSDRAVIIASDASLNTLVENNVIPDFIVSAEDLYLSWRFFANHCDILKNTPLVIPLGSNHWLTEKYPGKIIYTGEQKMPKALSKFNESLFQMESGQCVGHSAFHLAKFLNPSEIIMTGFDLALKDGEYHCQSMGTPYYKDNPESFELFDVKGIDGKMLKTSLPLHTYLKTFESLIRDCDCPVIDATEGGAMIEGAQLATLENALKNKGTAKKPELTENYEFNNLDANKVLDDLFAKLNALSGNLQNVRKKAKALSAACVRNPLSALPLSSSEFELVIQCGNSILMSNFCEIINSYSSSNFDEFNDALQEMFDDLDNSSDFLKTLLKFRNFAPDSNVVLCLVPPNKNVSGLIAEISGQKTEISSDTLLPNIWKEILTRKISTVISFDGAILPEIWSVPQIECRDIKTEYNPQSYERSLWLPGYMAACSNKEIFKKWRKFIPEDIECKLFKDII